MNIIFFLQIFLISCSSSTIDEANLNTSNPNNDIAKIVSVSTTGNENNYNFSVGISSPDKGCNQYANWWEVITEDGTLIYRRILGHSHVNEQPFVRSGGKVNIKKDQVIIIRVHMNNSGYSVNTFKGSINNGFSVFETATNFANNLASQNPLPTGCAF